MKVYFLGLMALMIISGCGQVSDVKSITSLATNGAAGLGDQSSSSAAVTGGAYTPGSYFKVLKDVGTNNDTRVYEFQYLNDGTFTMKQTSFPGGNLSSGYFHLKTGKYTEDKSGNITHSPITYDTCNDLSSSVASATGNPKDVISVTWKGSTLSLYSYLTYMLPNDINSQMGVAVEDIGCSKF